MTSYFAGGQAGELDFKLQPDGNGGADLMLQQVTSSSAHLLSLAGGGIKAMTADAGLFAGLLKHFASEGEPTTIGNLLSKVSALSANSGSSWFIDLLAYVPKFVNSLQNYTDFFQSRRLHGKA